MSFVPMKKLIDKAAEHGFAVPAFCAWNNSALKMVLQTAQELDAPVIAMSGSPEFTIFTPAEFHAMATAVKNFYRIPAAMLLDHGGSPEQVRACVAAGYTSVMLDYSQHPYCENAAALADICREVQPKGVTVEGEIGTVGFEGGVSGDGHQSEMTDVAEAERYVKETGIDIVAVSIGNVHGTYHGEPKLDFQRLRQIRNAVGIPLALHGSSGLPEVDIIKAVSLGIAKVNVATELVNAVKAELLEQWGPESKLWMPLTLSPAYEKMKPIIRKWLEITGAAGKAGLF